MDILNNVFNILTELCGINAICSEQSLQKDLGLDSLRMVTLLIMLEDVFHITLDETDMNPYDLLYVWQVIELVEKYLKGPSIYENSKQEN